jgi:hypothetical protein
LDFAAEPGAMPSESERLVVGFFHAMRAEAKRARRRPLPTQTYVHPEKVYADEWWVLTPLQRAAAERIAARESAREAEAKRRADRGAEAYAWERQFG